MTCISRIRNKQLQERLKLSEEEVVAAADSYAAAAQQTMLHSLDDSDFNLSLVSKDEMIEVYERRMAKKEAAGRAIYDDLISAPAHGRCPLCGQRIVSTLDHHLPKTLYPALAVDPLNLVPACADCNKLKMNKAPSASAEETLHPYFDNVENDPWLHAEVIEIAPAAVRFYVSPPPQWNDTLLRRVRLHFKTFNLAALYASQAAQELNNIKYILSQILSKNGPDQVREHLCDQAISRRVANINSWQTATYAALSSSTWFCEGGFEE
ncbi:HNH endonuclease [Planotetraspora mira]|nr:hypothetical protein [Planotetraspora mira]